MKITWINIIFLSALLSSFHSFSQNSVANIYSSNRISTSLGQYDPLCNGSSTPLVVTLPAGDSYRIDSIGIAYRMTAANGAWQSQQRSYIHCATLNLSEDQIFSGYGDQTGTLQYARISNLINGVYAGNTVFTFEMRAWRTFGGADCNELYNSVDNFSWLIVIYYSDEIPIGKVGINTVEAFSSLDVNGKMTISNSSMLQDSGVIRYNTLTEDFEGYDGTEWKSFTKGKRSVGDVTSVTETNISPPDGIPNDQFGYALAVNSEFLVASSPNKAIDTVKGKVYVFNRSLSYPLQTSLVDPFPAVKIIFGQSLAINSQYLAVGTRILNSANTKGKVYIFKKVNGNWQYYQTILSPSTFFQSESFGENVEMNETTLVISAHTSLMNIGKVFVYKLVNNVWTLNQTLEPESGTTQQYGAVIKLNNEYLAVGIPNYPNSLSAKGRVVLYRYDGANFLLDINLGNDPEEPFNYFGSEIAFKGRYLVIGDIMHNSVVGEKTGRLRIYKRDGNIWNFYRNIEERDKGRKNQYGFLTCMTPDRILAMDYSHKIYIRKLAEIDELEDIVKTVNDQSMSAFKAFVNFGSTSYLSQYLGSGNDPGKVFIIEKN